MTQLRYTAAAIVASLLFFGCGGQPAGGGSGSGSGSAAAGSGGVVHVYSTRHYQADKDLFAEFERETGITVKVHTAKAGPLLKRLVQEGEQTKADVLITVDAGRLHEATTKGMLQPIRSKKLEQAVPPHLRDPQGHWFALTVRARVIVYDRVRVSGKEIKSYADLADPKWKGKVLIRSSKNIYNQSLLASIIAHEGEEKALAWAKGVVANMARNPKGNDRDQVKAIASETGMLAVINTYYLGKLANSTKPAEREAAKKVSVLFPDQEGRGAHINISGAGVTKHAKNREAAQRLIEFLLTEDAQQTYAVSNYEYPVLAGVKASDLLRDMGEFKRDTLPMHKLGELNAKARKIFEAADWK